MSFTSETIDIKIKELTLIGMIDYAQEYDYIIYKKENKIVDIDKDIHSIKVSISEDSIFSKNEEDFHIIFNSIFKTKVVEPQNDILVKRNIQDIDFIKIMSIDEFKYEYFSYLSESE